MSALGGALGSDLDRLAPTAGFHYEGIVGINSPLTVPLEGQHRRLVALCPLGLRDLWHERWLLEEGNGFHMWVRPGERD